MTFVPLYRKSNHIDVHLTTTDQNIQNLIDEILDEIATIKKITNRSRSREALKKIILNLIHQDKTMGRLRISRDKGNYGGHKMYGHLWLKYDRLIPIVDGLIELGYVEHLKGYWDKEKRRGFQSKIWASDKLRSRLMGVRLPRDIKTIDRAEPNQIIQLKDSSKKL